MKYLKYLLLIPFYYLLYFYISQSQQLIERLDFGRVFPYLVIIISLVVVNLKYLSRRVRFWQVFSHELSHLIFAVLFLRKMTGFVVNEDSGVVSYKGRGNWIISLAPYSLPFFTLVLLAFAYVGNYYHVAHKLIISVSYSFYFSRMLQDFSWKQPDFEKTGILFSTLWVIGINFIIFILIVFYFQNELDFLWRITQSITF